MGFDISLTFCVRAHSKRDTRIVNEHSLLAKGVSISLELDALLDVGCAAKEVNKRFPIQPHFKKSAPILQQIQYRSAQRRTGRSQLRPAFGIFCEMTARPASGLSQ